MSFYRSGAFFWGIIVFIWLAYLYISGNVVVKDDSAGAIFEKYKDDPVFIENIKKSITYEEENLSGKEKYNTLHYSYQ